MKTFFRKITLFSSAFLMIVSIAPIASAHSGRTDSSGGHRDNKNVSGLGSYHYHCGGYPPHLHANGYCPYTDVFPSSVFISTSSNTLRMGKSSPITATVYPANSCNTYVSWSSSDPSVVTVSGGELIAVGFGTATITASTFNEVVTSVTIMVPEVSVEAIKIAALEIAEQSVDIGDSRFLQASVQPEDADRNNIIWTSSDESIATVSDGTVLARKEGTVTITAATENGKSDNIEIKVNEVLAESLDLECNDTLIIGESAYITATLNPKNTSYPNMTWESSDPSILTVDENGHICAIGVGMATIHAIQKNVTGTVDIEVLPIDVEDIDITHDTLDEEMGIGENLQFHANVFPHNATYPDISWSTSNTDIAVIDEEGLLTTIGAGEVIVYARTSDGAEEFITLTVVNKQAPVIIGVGSASGIAAIGGVAALVRNKRKIARSKKKGRFEK